MTILLNGFPPNTCENVMFVHNSTCHKKNHTKLKAVYVIRNLLNPHFLENRNISQLFYSISSFKMENIGSKSHSTTVSAEILHTV